MKKIHSWRQQLQEIMRMDNNQDELVPNNQKKQLQELAQEVGASTRGIGYYPDGKPFGYDASIAELIDNINQALQTATFIISCIYARRACLIAAVAVIISIFVPMWSISVAKKANRITVASLQNSYIPWLQVTSVKATLLDPNRVEIVHVCQNYTNAPALDLKIKYTISDVQIVGESPTYVSNPLMPNYPAPFNCIFTSPNQAKHVIENLNSGRSSVHFNIFFKDIFGHNIVVHQETRRINGKFRMTKYEIDGIDKLFEKIE